MKPRIFTAITLILASAILSGAFAGERWALPRVSVACVREKPGHSAELGTQVIMGTPLKVEESDSEWKSIVTPEGYKGYVIGNSLQMMDDEAFSRWRNSDRIVVTSLDQTYIYSTRDCSAENRLSDVVNGCILQENVAASDSAWVSVMIPDGRKGFMRRADTMEIGEWSRRPCRKQAVIELARQLTGTPYLWGGTSSKSMDCSGLTKLCYLSEGVILPRNASQQAKIGTEVDKSRPETFRTGDLLMFGNPATNRVNHVGLYIGNGRFIHCSGRVKINSLFKEAPDYTPISLLAVRHLDDAALKSLGVAAHPWYFNRAKTSKH